MKRAAVDISRSKFEVYNLATKYDLSEAAVDELLLILRNVGNMVILFTILAVFVLIMMMKSSSTKLELPTACRSDFNHSQSSIRQGKAWTGLQNRLCYLIKIFFC